jgi:hypothetical protein
MHGPFASVQFMTHVLICWKNIVGYTKLQLLENNFKLHRISHAI